MVTLQKKLKKTHPLFHLTHRGDLNPDLKSIFYLIIMYHQRFLDCHVYESWHQQTCVQTLGAQVLCFQRDLDCHRRHNARQMHHPSTWPMPTCWRGVDPLLLWEGSGLNLRAHHPVHLALHLINEQYDDLWQSLSVFIFRPVTTCNVRVAIKSHDLHKGIMPNLSIYKSCNPVKHRVGRHLQYCKLLKLFSLLSSSYFRFSFLLLLSLFPLASTASFVCQKLCPSKKYLPSDKELLQSGEVVLLLRRTPMSSFVVQSHVLPLPYSQSFGAWGCACLMSC